MVVFRKSEISKPIEDFPNYEVTNFGRVFNMTTGREMILSPTMNGDLTVGLVRDRRQFRYSVKGLVARAYVEGENDIFNTPVLLDGNKHNLSHENIVWRPRWFAWQYTRQFADVQNWYLFGPIVDITTEREYENYIDVAMEHGLLCTDIKDSIYNGRKVFPTRQEFAYLN